MSGSVSPDCPEGVVDPARNQADQQQNDQLTLASAYRLATQFLQALSPRTRARIANPLPEGGWANKYDQQVLLGDVEAGRPVSVYLGPGRRRGSRAGTFTLCPFDLDGTVASVIDLDQRFLLAHLTAAGIPAVVAASGPGHGRHVWTRCAEEIPAALVKRIADALTGAGGHRPLCPTLDAGPLLNPATGCLRVPGSPHRAGGHSRLLDCTTDKAIELLVRGAPLAAYERLAERLEGISARNPPRETSSADRTFDAGASKVNAGRVRRLPPSLARHGELVRPVIRDQSGRLRLKAPLRTPGEATRAALLAELDVEQDHSAHAFRVLKGLALAGYTYAAVVQLVAVPARSPGLEWLRTARPYQGAPLRVARSGWDSAALLDRQWELAVQAAARMPRRAGELDPAPEVSAAVADLLERMEAAGPARWSRPSGPADRAVLLAIALVMLTAGRLEVSLDIRRAALMTGYSRETANAAIHRLMADGWTCEVATADRARSQARTIGLAASHVCSGDHRHVCAPRACSEPSTCTGSDTRANARPPEGGRAVSGGFLYFVKEPGRLPGGTVKDQLEVTLREVRSEVWGLLGHHAAWTYQAIGDAPRPAAEVAEVTGYRRATVVRHLAGLQQYGLVVEEAGGWRRCERDVVEVVRLLPALHRTRGIDRAVAYALDRAIHRWWSAEVDWMSLSRGAKRVRGRRAPAEQTVLPGAAATARAYPRDVAGAPDHARALQIEAARLELADRVAWALQQLDVGAEIDPLHLLAVEPLDRPTAAVAAGQAA